MKTSAVIASFLLDKRVYCSSKTILNYTEHLNRFVKHIPKNIEDLTSDDIRKYIIYLKDSGVRNVSIHTYMRSVKAFCTWLEEFEYTEYNLFNKIKLPRPDPALKVPLSVEEVKKIDKILNDRDKIIFHLMLDAGLRVSEVCNLQKQDVDLKNGLIKVNNSKYNKSRLVPLVPELANMIQLYPDANKNETYLLSNRHGSQLTNNAVKQLFQRIKRDSGLQRVHAHLLRHTFATSYIVGGGNLEKLRIMLGHADYSITQNYLHLAAQFDIVRYPIYRLNPIFFKKGY